MRLLFAIPHYFKPSEDGAHGSLRGERAQRARVLRRSIAALHQPFGPRQVMIDIAQRVAARIGACADDAVEVVVCTTGGEHVLGELGLGGAPRLPRPRRGVHLADRPRPLALP